MRWAVQSSSIHGQGLFARYSIPRGAIIGVCEGEPTDEDGPHVLWIDQDKALHVCNDMRYINHSPKPNAAYYDDATVVALRDIKPGEEITHDYGDGLDWE
jgi:hypothetical protein